MAKMKVTDEQIAESFRRTQSAAQTGRELNVRRQTISARISRMRKRGIDLPPSKPSGWLLNEARESHQSFDSSKGKQ